MTESAMLCRRRRGAYQVFHSSFENALFDSGENDLELFGIATRDELKSASPRTVSRESKNNIRSASKVNDERSCSFVSIQRSEFTFHVSATSWVIRRSFVIRVILVDW